MNYLRVFQSRRSHLVLLLALSLLAIPARAESPIPALTPTERENICLSRKADGTLASATSPEEWKSRRDSILKAAQSIMGSLPGDANRCPLDIKIEEEADCGTYVRRLISYSAEPGGRTPAYLCIPKAALKARCPRPPFSACIRRRTKSGSRS